MSLGASGLRHLRWAREILATLEAHARGESLLSEADREALAEEAARVRELVNQLSGAVKPYRDFLERTRVVFRGSRRAASFAHEEARRRAAQRIGFEEHAVLTARVAETASLLETHTAALARVEDEQRRPLKHAVRSAVGDLHRGLLEMIDRLRRRFPEPLIESLFPELTAGGTLVADQDDEDDDATAPPAPSP